MDIRAVYESVLPRLKRIAAGLGLRPADAEDASHDTYVALLQRREPFSEDADAGRWLVRVMVNRCLLHHRQRRRGQRAAAVWLTQRREPTAGHGEVEEIVRQGLAEMDPDELEVLVLRYFGDLNATEIGELMMIPAGTVRRRLHLARLKLAERLIAKGVVDDE